MPLAKPKRSVRKKKRHKSDVIMPVDSLQTVTSTIKRFNIAASDRYLDIQSFTYNITARQLTATLFGSPSTEDKEFRANILRKHFKTLKLEYKNVATGWVPGPLATFSLDDSQSDGSTMMYWVLSADEDTTFQTSMALIQNINLDSRWRWGK